MKLRETAKKVEAGIEETLTYCDFPGEHWTRIRTRVVGCPPFIPAVPPLTLFRAEIQFQIYAH